MTEYTSKDVYLGTTGQWEALSEHRLETIERLLEKVKKLEPASPDDIRAQGWVVAIHNDYRLNDQSYTFWLFTKDGKAIKGEGFTDADALGQVRAQIENMKPARIWDQAKCIFRHPDE